MLGFRTGNVVIKSCMAWPTWSNDDGKIDMSTTALDKDAIQKKYKAERDKRLRPEGNAQYKRLVEFEDLAQDPHTPWVDRAPVTDHVTFAFIGPKSVNIASVLATSSGFTITRCSKRKSRIWNGMMPIADG